MVLTWFLLAQKVKKTWRIGIKELKLCWKGLSSSSTMKHTWYCYKTKFFQGKALTDTESIVSSPHIFSMRAWASMPIFYITGGSTKYSCCSTGILADPVLVHKGKPKPHHLFVPLSSICPTSTVLTVLELCTTTNIFSNAWEKEGLHPRNPPAKAVGGMYSAPVEVQ